MKRPLNRAAVSNQTQLLINRLLKPKPGEIISYDELNACCGSDVRPGQPGYHYLYAARRIIERDERRVFSAVTRQGVQRLTDEEIAQTGRGHIKAIRKRSRRGARMLACAEYEKLPEPHRVIHNRDMAVLLLVGQFTKPSSVKQIEEKIDCQKAIPQTTEMLKLFSSGDRP